MVSVHHLLFIQVAAFLQFPIGSFETRYSYSPLPIVSLGTVKSSFQNFEICIILFFPNFHQFY